MAGKILTITEQIYQEIRNEIITRSLQPGEKLTIKMLNEKYGVSSSPIREALAHLQQDGLINYKPNAGMTVIELTATDLEELFSFMAELDVIALTFAYESSNREGLITTLARLQAQANALIDDQSGLWNKLSDDFHLAFYEYAGNSRLSEAAEKIRLQFTVFTHAYEESMENRAAIIREHQDILDAVKAGEIETAKCNMRNHIISSKHKALALL